jgi:hypothetical protein
MITDDELFLAFETICSTLTRLWYGQEKLGYPALLILVECCTTNICAAGISWKVISLQLKGYCHAFMSDRRRGIGMSTGFIASYNQFQHD